MADDLTLNPDIQGLLLHAFAKLKHSSYGLFKIDDRVSCQKWLDKLLAAGEISTAQDGDPKQQEGKPQNNKEFRLNIMFTASGMEKLLGKGWIPQTFEPAFVEGMVNAQRSRVLGDVEDNDPSKWRWGANQEIDGVLIAYATTKSRADSFHKKHIKSKNGTLLIDNFNGFFKSRAEAFGFIDGVSQPVLNGSETHKKLLGKNVKTAKLHTVAHGELVLGYKDGSGSLPRSPATSSACDCCDNLPSHWEWPERRDIGKNGSYVVIRQLAQDTQGFSAYLEKVAKKCGLSADEIAEKMIGRRKNGSPLTPPGPKEPNSRNSFDYTDDPQGLHCPVGSHIRRSNPRATGAPKPEDALSVTLRHRILRRGRSYEDKDRNEVGLNFLCFNASISRQFEFVQSAWCNNPFFHGQEKEVDPIVGTVISKSGPLGAINRFTIPGKPYRRVLEDLPTFVTVKGGGYFFMPSMSALSCLSKAD